MEPGGKVQLLQTNMGVSVPVDDVFYYIIYLKVDGSVQDAMQVDVDPYLDKEALRVIGLMPKWKPGKQRGKAVRVRYTQPVLFRLN